MRFLHLLTSLCIGGSAFAAPSTSVNFIRQAAGFSWGGEKLRGVNLGGWLVLEPWITPSIFERYPVDRGIVDEFTLCKQLGKEEAGGILREHWDSWVTRGDFEKLKQSGFNLVRIPVGFWAYETFKTPYVKGAAPYVDTAVGWARELGLKVIIDLHGAPGSQNGFDNSGRRRDNPQWGQGKSIPQTLRVIEAIAKKYAKQTDVVAGIELLNEPAGFALDGEMIKQFYRDGYGRVRDQDQGVPVIFSDAFKNPSEYNGFPEGAQNVVVDHHYYQVFSPEEVARTPQQQLDAVCQSVQSYNGADKWSFIGEFTGALTDCAKWLNGYGRGARYGGTYKTTTKSGSCDGINDIGSWSDAKKEDTRKFIELQLNTFEKETEGWVWWNFKTENAPEWDAFKLLDAGIMPNPVGNRRDKRAC